MREVVEDACRRIGGPRRLATLLGLSDHRVVAGWLEGRREPQPRFRSTLLSVAGHTADWRDLPRHEIAHRLGVHPRTVAAWQRGDREIPQRHLRALEAHQPGDALRLWRRRNALTSAEMAAQVGVHIDTLLSWERSERMPDADAHHRLYRVVGEEALWWWPLGELNRCRRRLGLYREEIADVLGVSMKALRSLESGLVPLTSVQRSRLDALITAKSHSLTDGGR